MHSSIFAPPGLGHHKAFEEGRDLLVDMTAMSELLSVQKKVGYVDTRGIPKNTFSNLAKRLKLNNKILKSIDGEFNVRMKEAMRLFDVKGQAAPEFSERYEL